MSYIRITTANGQVRLAAAPSPRTVAAPFMLKPAAIPGAPGRLKSQDKPGTDADPAHSESPDCTTTVLPVPHQSRQSQQQPHQQAKQAAVEALAQGGETQSCAKAQSERIVAVSAIGEEISLIDSLSQITEPGIFELLLPEGESLGVALDMRAGGMTFLLSGSSASLNARLQQQKMELEGALRQRIGSAVTITVLSSATTA